MASLILSGIFKPCKALICNLLIYVISMQKLTKADIQNKLDFWRNKKVTFKGLKESKLILFYSFIDSVDIVR